MTSDLAEAPPAPAAPPRGRSGLTIALQVGGAFVGLGLLALLLWRSDPRAIGAELARLGPGALLFLVPSLFIQLVDALGWRLCFAERPPVGFPRLLLIRTAGESVNNTLPVAHVGGEPVKALLLSRVAGLPLSQGMASVIVAKTGMVVAQLAFVLLGILAAFLSGATQGRAPSLAVGGAVLVLLAVLGLTLAYLAQRHGPGRILARLAARLHLGRAAIARHQLGLDRLDAALAGFYRRRPLAFVAATGLFLIGWLLETLEVLVFVTLLDLPLSPLACLAIAALASVARAAGFFSPGSLGVQEGGQLLLFVAFGQAPATALAYAVVRRSRDLLWIVIGLSALAAYGLRAAAPALAAAEAAAAAEGEDPPRAPA